MIGGMVCDWVREVRNKKRIALAGQIGGLAAHKLGHASRLGQRLIDDHGTGIDRAEHGEGMAIQRLLHHRA